MTDSQFSKIAANISGRIRRHVSKDRDGEWQRVNSYIADTLKDTHVLYAKLARLQGDFAGAELSQLQKISEAVLVLGEELSVFSKEFYQGKYEMQESEFIYGDTGGSPVPNPDAAPAPPSPAPEQVEPSEEFQEALDGGDQGESSEGADDEEDDETDYEIPVEVEEPDEEAEEQEQDDE
jgi:hypothetical protein